MLGRVHDWFVGAMTIAILIGVAGWVGGELTQAPGKFNLAPTFKFLLAIGKSGVQAADGKDFDYENSKPAHEALGEFGGKVAGEASGAIARYQGEDVPAPVPPEQTTTAEQMSPAVDNRLLACPQSSVQNAESRVSLAKVSKLKDLWESGQLRMADLIEAQSALGEPNCIFGANWWRFLVDDGFGIVDVKAENGSLSFEFFN
jgi:hypothetical protein